jgi:hypothetical protein
MYSRLDTFSDAISFFLSIPRSRSIFNASTLQGYHDPSDPFRALINAVYLWGIVLSPDERLKPFEAVYLSRAIHYNTRALSSDLPQSKIHIIQTEVLLSKYFFNGGHFLEGISHSRLAALVVIRCGYHQYRHIYQPIPPPTGTDPIHEGEIINAFWASYIVETIWATELNRSSAFLDAKGDDGRIDTPWPLDMAQYEIVRNFAYSGNMS